MAAKPKKAAARRPFEASSFYRLRCGEGEQHVDAARRRRRAHRLQEAAAAAAACEQLSPRHADGRDADLGYIGLQGGPAVAPPLTYNDY